MSSTILVIFGSDDSTGGGGGAAEEVADGAAVARARRLHDGKLVQSLEVFRDVEEDTLTTLAFFACRAFEGQLRMIVTGFNREVHKFPLASGIIHVRTAMFVTRGNSTGQRRRTGKIDDIRVHITSPIMVILLKLGEIPYRPRNISIPRLVFSPNIYGYIVIPFIQSMTYTYIACPNTVNVKSSRRTGCDMSLVVTDVIPLNLCSVCIGG